MDTWFNLPFGVYVQVIGPYEVFYIAPSITGEFVVTWLRNDHGAESRQWVGVAATPVRASALAKEWVRPT